MLRIYQNGKKVFYLGIIFFLSSFKSVSMEIISMLFITATEENKNL